MIDNKKIKRLTNRMKKEDYDAVLIGPSADLKYFTGLSPYEDERVKLLFIRQDGEHFFIAPEMWANEIVLSYDDKAKIYKWSDSEGFLPAVRKAAKEFNLVGTKIAVNEGIRVTDFFQISQVIKADYYSAEELLSDLRMIKSKEEVSYLRKAAQIIDSVMGDVIKSIKPGVTERKLKQMVKELCIEKGADGIFFEPVIPSGENTSLPHYNDDKRAVRKKDIITLDIGCSYKGYGSDTTRTVFVGQPTEEEKKVYKIVQEANRYAEEIVKDGITAEEVDKAARGVIEEAGYGDFFIHRTGHGIGITVHEEPYIRAGNKLKIRSGMSFSIEPGIYLPGKFGVRIEDIIVARDDGAEVLNKFTKDLIVL